MRMLRPAAVVFAGVCLLTITTLRAQQVSSSYFSGLHWRNIGPPRSGYVAVPAGVPGDPTTYYAGMPEGGVCKTTNGGLTWKPIFDAVGVASVGGVAVAPSDPRIVYVGTGNQSGWSFTTGKGVYKSVDAGSSWTKVGLPASQYIGGIVVDPRNANNVIVAAQGSRGGGPGERGVYRSTDSGRNWSRVLPADGSAGASDVYLDYGDPQIVYALLTAGVIPTAGAAPADTSNTGIYKSVDGGATWKPIAGKGLGEGGRIAAFAVSSGTH